MKKRSKASKQSNALLPEPGGELDALESAGLTPLQIIRTETVISRLPIHNLVKGGEVDIQISRKNEHGKVTLHWEVSPSSRFGHPGQLAYKLDTIVINRIIDEVGRPVPKLIKIGTLNQLCKDLGSQKAELKKSLRQNAATTISAKLRYTSNEGQERTLEAIFSRYSVVFTGETLPTGEKADEIYVIFNDPYLEVLNSAPIRPLNYEYLKELSPTSQRFYEIISYRIYAAVKYNHPRAKFLYSEYCTYSAQRRHGDFERARVQMYRVHKPHLDSEYITKVEYEDCVDGEGKPDWIIYYTPGPKAKAEFQTFNRRQGSFLDQESDEVEQGRLLGDREKQSVDSTEDSGVGNAGIDLVKQFHLLARGKSDYQPTPVGREVSQADALLAKYGREKTEYIVRFAVQEARKTNFQMRTFGAVLQYVNEAERHFEQESERQFEVQTAQTTLVAEQAERLQLETTAYQRAEVLLENLPEDEFRTLYETVKEDLFQRHSEVMRRFDKQNQETTIRAGILKTLVAKVYEEWESAGGI